MLRQANNKVFIEGILSEMDLKEGSYMRDGADVPYISGTIKIKVYQKIEKDGKEEELDIPVSVFAPKFTKAGKVNQSYTSIKGAQDTLVSIAAAGGETGADRVRISGANLAENAYVGKSGEVVCYPRIHASFITKIRATECEPKATFNVELFVAGKDYELDKDGVETGRYLIKAVIPQYGGKVDVVEFVGASKGVVDALSQYWEVGGSYAANGKLNFTSKTITKTIEQGFGEPETKSFTTNVSELVITGGSQTALDDTGFDASEIKAALAERKARHEELKNKTPKAAPASTGFSSDDLGF